MALAISVARDSMAKAMPEKGLDFFENFLTLTTLHFEVEGDDHESLFTNSSHMHLFPRTYTDGHVISHRQILVRHFDP